jgi:hypothetical protein
MLTLKAPKDVESIHGETLAYQINDREIDLTTLSVDVLRAMINQVKPVRDELSKEYNNGDALCYPPDWYDHYVFPLDSAISNCQWEIESRYNNDDSEEDSEW